MGGNLQVIPPSVYASWPQPNYVDPHRRTWIIPFAGVLQAIATLMVATRLWLRTRHQAGALGYDDALLVPAYLAATMFTTLIILSTEKYGTDRHTWDVPPTKFEYTALMAWLSEFSFLIATASTKISVLLFYRRLVQGTFSKRWKLATIGAIFFTVLYCLAFVFVLIFNCRPTEAYWKAYSPFYTEKYTCTTTMLLNPLSGVLSVFSDLYSVVLPMMMLRHFEAPVRQKIALNAVFSLGLLVVAAGSVRTYWLWKLGKTYDVTWVGYNTYVWAALEIDLSIICACAPACRILLRQYLQDPFSRAFNSARSATSTRNTKRDSLELGVVTCSSHNRAFSRSSQNTAEKNLIQHQVQPSLETVSETSLEAISQLMGPREANIVKTPADFEAYALRNLEKNRPPLRPAHLRFESDADSMSAGDMQPHVRSYSPPNRYG